MTGQTPTIARNVIFVDIEHYENHVAAIVTGVHPGDGTIDLTAFPPGRDPVAHTGIPEGSADAPTDGTWHWPPRV